MKNARLVLAALVLATVGGSMLTASASHCGTTARNAHDPFGSCENSTGAVLTECGTAGATDAAGAAKVIVVNSGGAAGVQGCAGQGSSLPIRGRVGVYKGANNDTSVFIDGDDNANQSGAGGWQRYDVRPSDQSKLVCARRGSGGTWSTGGNGSSNADAGVNHSVGTGGPGTCQ